MKCFYLITVALFYDTSPPDKFNAAAKISTYPPMNFSILQKM